VQLLVNKKNQKNKSKINYIILILLSLITVLFIFGIVILVIALNRINNLKVIFNLNKDFNSCISNYYETLMNVMQNVLILDKGIKKNAINSTIFKQINNEFSHINNSSFYKNNDLLSNIFIENNSTKEYYCKYYEIGVVLDLPIYFNNETLIKINFVKNFISGVQESFLSVGNTDVIGEILNNKIKYNYISNYNDKIEILEKEIVFFDFMDLFLANTKILAQNPQVFTILFITDTSNNFFNFQYFSTKDLNIYQITAINLIINIEIITERLEYFRLNISNLFNSQINQMEKLINFSNFILAFFHILLVVLIILIIKYFKNTLHSNILVLEYLIKKEKIIFLKKKIKNLKQLSFLYKISPHDGILNLKNNRKKFNEIKLLKKIRNLKEL